MQDLHAERRASKISIWRESMPGGRLPRGCEVAIKKSSGMTARVTHARIRKQSINASRVT
jgi:hypothetical protein